MRSFILCLAATLVLPFAGEAPALDRPKEIKRVKVGFRADAEPFSYVISRRENGRGENRFTGYIADLCYKIFEGDGYELEAHVITAADRFDRLRPKEDFHAFKEDHGTTYRSVEGEELDVICDPITLRYSSHDGREKGLFSPIVFVSGISYLRLQPRSIKKPIQIGYLVNTTAATWAETAKEQDWFNAKLRGQEYKSAPKRSHTELIEWFCDPENMNSEYRVYFGDLDIISGKLGSFDPDKKGCARRARASNNTRTYEPYAILVTREDPVLYQHVQRRIYEIFSNRGEMVGLFTKHFPDKAMSKPLAHLFLLNGIERDAIARQPPKPIENKFDLKDRINAKTLLVQLDPRATENSIKVLAERVIVSVRDDVNEPDQKMLEIIAKHLGRDIDDLSVHESDGNKRLIKLEDSTDAAAPS